MINFNVYRKRVNPLAENKITKSNTLQISFSLKARYIFHRNKYITTTGTIIWQHLYTMPFTIKKISGNGNAIHQFVSVQLFLYTSWPAGVFARIQKKMCGLNFNNIQKALAAHFNPICTIQSLGMFLYHYSDLIHLLLSPFPRNKIF